MVAGGLAALWVAAVGLWVWDMRRRDRRFAEVIARLACHRCGTVYGPTAAAGRRWTGIKGPPGFVVRCPSCGDEAVRVLRSWVDP